MIGVAAGGNVPVNVPVQSAQAGAFITAAGFGPGPQLAELILNETGNEVVFIQAAQALSGVCSPVSIAAANTGAAVMTFTGLGGTGTAAPFDTAYVSSRARPPASSAPATVRRSPCRWMPAGPCSAR